MARRATVASAPTPSRRPSKNRSHHRRSRSAPVLILALTALFLWAAFESTSRPLLDFEGYLRSAPQISRAWSPDGVLVGEWARERRSVVRPSQISDALQTAVVLAEDDRFWTHPGVDWRGLARALWADLRAGAVVQGGSTITQQVAKTLYLNPERTWARKWSEAWLAFRLERKLTKRDLLAIYLNHIYLGHGNYGVEEASRYYFGKGAVDVDWAEAALMATLIPAPERRSPFRDPDNSRRRRDLLLRRLAAAGAIRAPELREALDTPLPAASRRQPVDTAFSWYADVVKREVDAALGPEALPTAGLRIEVAMDAALQRKVHAAVRAHLRVVDSQFGTWRKAQELTPPPERLFWLGAGWAWAHVDRAEHELGGYVLRVGGEQGWLPFVAVERYLPDGASMATWLQPGERVPVVKAQGSPPPALPALTVCDLDTGPQAAAVILDRGGIYVRAVSGGYRADNRPFNRALLAERQMGSTVKPFVMAAALDSTAIGRDHHFFNSPLGLPGAHGRAWVVANGAGFDGRPYSISEALAKSLNTASVQALRLLGPARFAEVLSRMGLPTPTNLDLTLALGSSGATPLQLAVAYAALANGGVLPTPRTVVAVHNLHGDTLWMPPSANQSRVLTPTSCGVVAHGLRAAVERGTAKRAQVAGNQVAGKTGTTNESRDCWFAGWTDSYVAAIWVGYDWPRPLAGASGGNVAAPLFARILSE